MMLYAASMWCTKISLLAFIRRLAGPAASKKMIWGIWGIVFFITAHVIVTIVMIITWCMPIRVNWDLQARFDPEAKCKDLHAFYWASSALHCLSDLVVLALPIKMAWNLQMTTSKKVGIVTMFGLGAL